MTPESFHALELHYQGALSDGDVEKVKWLSLIDKFFVENGFAIIDESHRNADSLFQANKAAGNPKVLNKFEQDFLIDIYKQIMGLSGTKISVKGTPLHELLKLRENGQATLTDSSLRRIKVALAENFLDNKTLKIPVEANRDALKEFLLNEELDAPAWLDEWNEKGTEEQQKQAKLISLSRGLLTKIFPHTFGLVGEMEYGLSINSGDELEAPRKQRNATTSRFEVPDIAACLSIQGRFQRGLTTQAEFEKLLNLLKKEALDEKQPGQNLDKTETAQKFLAWQGDNKYKISLEEANAKSPETVKKLIASLGKNPDVVELYLRRFVMPQVKIFPYKFTSTAQDLMAGFNGVVLFSATLGSSEQYLTLGDVEDKFQEDLAFQAEVAHRACLEHNSDIHWLKPSNPGKLFEDLYQKDSQLFDRLDGSLDMRGWNKDYSGFETAKQFLEFAKAHQLPFNGVTYFQQEVLDNGKLGDKKLYYLAQGQSKGIPLPSTQISLELQKLGLESKRVFKIYSPEDTTGTDLILSKDAKMLFLLGEGTTFSLEVQTIMRMRQFLANPIDANTSQSIVWVGPEHLKHKIKGAIKAATDQKPSKITPVQCLEWGIIGRS